MLDGICFRELCDKYGEPHIDLFASRINHQLPVYMSLHPDAQAHAIDAFAHSWESYVYIFPPFILISRILKKIREDKTPKVLMIVPNWSVAPWFPMMKKMCIHPPVLLETRKICFNFPTTQITNILFFQN